MPLFPEEVLQWPSVGLFTSGEAIGEDLVEYGVFNPVWCLNLHISVVRRYLNFYIAVGRTLSNVRNASLTRRVNASSYQRIFETPSSRKSGVEI